MEGKLKKKKLTLTVREDIIRKAKQRAKEQGISLSKFFEQVIEEKVEEERINNEKSKKIEEYLKHYNEKEPIQALPQSDKELWHEHLDSKYG